MSYLASGADRRRFQIDVGKFLTQFGAERVAPDENWNASRSLLFALAIPWEFVGVRVAYRPTDRLDVTGFFVDGWTGASGHEEDKRVSFSVSARPSERVTVVESYTGGPAPTSNSAGWRHLSDTVITARVTHNLSLASNFDIGEDRSRLQSWGGVAVYLKYQVTDWLALSPRIETLQDHDGFMTGEGQDLQELTVTTELRPSRSSVVRIEYPSRRGRQVVFPEGRQRFRASAEHPRRQLGVPVQHEDAHAVIRRTIAAHGWGTSDRRCAAVIRDGCSRMPPDIRSAPVD